MLLGGAMLGLEGARQVATQSVVLADGVGASASAGDGEQLLVVEGGAQPNAPSGAPAASSSTSTRPTD